MPSSIKQVNPLMFELEKICFKLGWLFVSVNKEAYAIAHLNTKFCEKVVRGGGTTSYFRD